MRDLSRWPDGTFDLIVHPLSNLYVPDVTPVWREAHRVLRPGGVLLSGFMNPHVNLFDQETWRHPNPPLRFTLPYSELTSLPAPERDALIEGGDVLQFGHTLDDQLGGQLRAGFSWRASSRTAPTVTPSRRSWPRTSPAGP